MCPTFSTPPPLPPSSSPSQQAGPLSRHRRSSSIVILRKGVTCEASLSSGYASVELPPSFSRSVEGLPAALSLQAFEDEKINPSTQVIYVSSSSSSLISRRPSSFFNFLRLRLSVYQLRHDYFSFSLSRSVARESPLFLNGPRNLGLTLFRVSNMESSYFTYYPPRCARHVGKL